MGGIFIIEHLEKRVHKWCLFEYENISKIVGKENLWFTNIKRKNKKLEKIGKCFKERVADLNLEDAVVLDPDSDQILTPEDSKKFQYYIFGGILGDYPPKQRTKEELTRFLNFPTRNIGKEQFSTDNAVLVVKKILDGTPFEKIEFVDKPEIQFSEFRFLELPYRYPLVDGKPQMSKKLLNFLKHKKGF